MTLCCDDASVAAYKQQEMAVEDIVRFLKILFVFLIFALPAIFPFVAIPLGILIWTVVYVYLGVASLSYDPTADLPWMIADPTTSVGVLFVFVILVGILNGIKGAAGMLAVWGPAIMLSSYMTTIGLAVEHERGWYGYMHENYIDPGCEVNGNPCLYKPLSGRQLPSFIADMGNRERVLEVIPYSK